jgi:hypothetical protein
MSPDRATTRFHAPRDTAVSLFDITPPASMGNFAGFPDGTSPAMEAGMNHFLPFRRSSSSRSLLAPMLLGALVAATGCESTPQPAYEQATFGYASFGPLNTPLAAGASDAITIAVPASVVVDHATSSDPTVLSLGAIAATPGEPDSYTVPVTGVKPGSVTLTAYDASNAAIDQVTVQVAAATGIALDGSSGATLLQGQWFALHASTIGLAGGALAGTGAVQFAYGGALGSSGGPGPLCQGDCSHFEASAPGDGQVTATSGGATASLAFSVVPITAIDTLSFASSTLAITASGSATTAYTLQAAGVTVYTNGTELRCVSSDESVALVVNGGDGLVAAGVGQSGSTGSLLVDGLATGSATITCTVGGLQETVSVTVR